MLRRRGQTMTAYNTAQFSTINDTLTALAAFQTKPIPKYTKADASYLVTRLLCFYRLFLSPEERLRSKNHNSPTAENRYHDLQSTYKYFNGSGEAQGRSQLREQHSQNEWHDNSLPVPLSTLKHLLLSKHSPLPLHDVLQAIPDFSTTQSIFSISYHVAGCFNGGIYQSE